VLDVTRPEIFRRGVVVLLVEGFFIEVDDNFLLASRSAADAGRASTIASAFSGLPSSPMTRTSSGLVDVIAPRAVTSTNTTDSCFAQAEHRGTYYCYCVPNRANRTKRLFTLLHQLQQLSTAPSNVPTTLTVTTVP
jgi:hypothetical protein